MELERINSTKYDEDTIDTALLTLVMNDYNVARTARDLEAHADIKVPVKTLAHWKNIYPRRLQFHATNNARQIEERIVTKQRAIASSALDVVQDAIEKEARRVEAGEVKDMSSVARNLSVVHAVNVDKLLNLTGRPSAIVEHKRPEQIIERLAQLGVIDTTAEEIDADDHEVDSDGV